MRRPSLIQVVSDLQSQSRGVGGNVPVPGDTGWAQAGKEIAGDFKRIADHVGSLADQAARREGESEGREAGLDPEFRTRADGTIYSEAFNRTGLDIAEARLKTSLEQQIDGLEEQHAASPQALAKGIDGVVSGTLTNAPAELRPKLQMWAGHKRLVAMRSAQRELISRTRAEAAAAQQLELTEGFKTLSQMSFKLGLDGEADQVLGERVAALSAVLGRKGADGRPLLDPKAAARMLDGIKSTVAEARLKGAFDRLETPEAKVDFLRRLDDDFKNSRGLPGQFGLDKYESLRSELEGEMRRAEAGRGVVRRALANQIKTIQQAAEQGLPPAPDDLVKLRAATAATPELAADLAQAEATLRFTSGFRRLPPLEQESWIEQERLRLMEAGVRTGGAELERLKMAEKLTQEARTQIKTDPLGWSSRTGLVEVAPLNLSGPTTVAASLPQRIAQAETIARVYDQEPKYLRPDEARRLTALAAGGGKDLLEVVDALSAAGPEASRRMFAELNEAGSATLAAIGGHVQEIGRSRVAQDVADGVALSRTKDFKLINPTEKGRREMALEVHQGALNGFPKQEQALSDAANYAHAVRAQGKGKTEDREAWKQAFRELLGERVVGGETYGGIARYRGQAIVVPPDLKQDAMPELMRSIELGDFEVPPMTAGRRTASAAAIRQAKLVPAGAGRFYLNIGDDDAPEWLANAEGGKFVLDMKALKPRLAPRRPDLYLDGAAARRPRIGVDDTGGAGAN